MAKITRTQRQIENDVKRLQEAAKTAKNMKDLEKATGLTYSMIKTSLLNHPIITNRIRDLLAANSKKSELEKKKINTNSNVKNSFTEKSMNTVITNTPKFVIDSSIADVEDLELHLKKLFSCKATIIIPTIVVDELKKMLYFRLIDGNNSKCILDLLSKKPKNLRVISIDDAGCIDDSILKYCVDNNENLTLLTAKEKLAMSAKLHSVHVHYFKSKGKVAKIMTLYSAKKIGDNLLISNFNNHKCIRVYSNGIEYNDSIRELHIDDDVYISVKKDDYFTFAHYRIISLCEKDNCELLFSTRIYYDQKEINVPNSLYKSFIKDFMSKFIL